MTKCVICYSFKFQKSGDFLYDDIALQCTQRKMNYPKLQLIAATPRQINISVLLNSYLDKKMICFIKKMPEIPELMR